MKLRVSDTDILNTDRLDFIEIDGCSISFYVDSKVYESIYNNELEAQCVFNNLNTFLSTTDARFEGKDKAKSESDRKEKGFEMFWTLYDKKVDRVKSRTAFMNLTMKEMGEAIKGVKPYVDSTPDKKYRKNATTWLHNKGWNNEIKLESKATNRYVKPKYITDER